MVDASKLILLMRGLVVVAVVEATVEVVATVGVEEGIPVVVTAVEEEVMGVEGMEVEGINRDTVAVVDTLEGEEGGTKPVLNVLGSFIFTTLDIYIFSRPYRPTHLSFPPSLVFEHLVPFIIGFFLNF